MKWNIYLLMLCFFVPFTMNAQENFNRFSIDVAGGVNYTHGDISSTFSPAADLGFRYAISEQFSVRANLRKGWLRSGDDSYGREFENDFYQASLQTVFNLSKITDLYSLMPRVGFHTYIGVGFMKNNAVDLGEYSSNEVSSPRPDYEETNMVIPFGGTIKYRVSNVIDLNLNVGYVYANSDEIDNYSRNLESNRFNDGYSTYTAGLTFKLGKSNRDHYDWVQLDARKMITEMERKYDRRLKELDQRMNEIEKEVDSNGLLIWVNEAAILDLKEEMKKIDLDKEKAPEKQVYQPFDENRFKTIVASFRNMERANDLANELKSKGEDVGVLQNYYRNWYYVYISETADVNKARKNLPQVRKNYNGAWIYFRSADDLEKYKTK